MFSQSTFAELCRSNEDNVSGKVSYSWFIQFSDKYENEQKKIKEVKRFALFIVAKPRFTRDARFSFREAEHLVSINTTPPRFARGALYVNEEMKTG